MVAYIIDTYNKYDQFDREHARYLFTINGVEYAVKEVQLKWGRPRLPLSIEHDTSKDSYHIYETLAEAVTFARTIKSIN